MLIRKDHRGLHCMAGGFHIDPLRPVPLAIITHAHADHARPGSGHYIAHPATLAIMRHRFPTDFAATPLDYNTPMTVGQTEISLHSAGHILGSAQIRVEHKGQVWVACGDYKRQADPTCPAFEPVPCDTLISEATFALPIYQWPDTDLVVEEMWRWVDDMTALGKTPVLLAYSLGKTQRIMMELAKHRPANFLLHPAADAITRVYEEQGVDLPNWVCDPDHLPLNQDPVIAIAPPGGHPGPWSRRLTKPEAAFVSGWMRLRGARRRRGFAKGFVISDHADWPGLVQTVRDTQAKQTLLTHGNASSLSRYLNELNFPAAELAIGYEGEDGL